MVKIILNTFMVVFRFQIFESQTTDLAVEWSLACVHWHVGFHMILRVESSITHSTLKILRKIII